MTRGEFDLFLTFGAGLCLVLALINLFRFRTRGPSAFVLAGALLAMGTGMLLYRLGFGMGAVWAVGIIVFILLAADLVIRSVRGGTR